MLTIEQMIVRVVLAAVLGAVVGIEREWVGKEAGVRTDIMIASGAAIFSMIGLLLPSILISTYGSVLDEHALGNLVIYNGGFFSVIGNVVAASGFLGAGIIIKQGIHVRGLTTAATMWFVAAVGVLAGLGLGLFATAITLGMVLLLVVLRKTNVRDVMPQEQEDERAAS